MRRLLLATAVKDGIPGELTLLAKLPADAPHLDADAGADQYVGIGVRNGELELTSAGVLVVHNTDKGPVWYVVETGGDGSVQESPLGFRDDVQRQNYDELRKRIDVIGFVGGVLSLDPGLGQAEGAVSTATVTPFQLPTQEFSTATPIIILPSETPEPTATLEPTPTLVPHELVANMLAIRGAGEWVEPNPRFGGIDVYFVTLGIVRDLEIKAPDGSIVGVAAWGFRGVSVDENGLAQEMFFTNADRVYSESDSGVNLYGQGVDSGVLDEFEAILKQEAEEGHMRIRGVGVLASKEEFAQSLAQRLSQNGAAKADPSEVQEFMGSYYEAWGAGWESLKEGGGARGMKVIVGISSIGTDQMVDIPDGLN